MVTRNWIAGTGAAIVALLFFIGTRATEPQIPYAQAYMQALGQFPGESPVTQEHLERFANHFTHMADVPQATRETLYAKNLYFSDGLLTTRQRDAVFQHFDTLHADATELNLRVIDTISKGEDVYLVWWAQLNFTPLFKTVRSQAIGITHLRFNACGQVVLQQDYWDTGEAFYKHIPIVGSAIRQIGSGFQDVGK